MNVGDLVRANGSLHRIRRISGFVLETDRLRAGASPAADGIDTRNTAVEIDGRNMTIGEFYDLSAKGVAQRELL